MFFDSKFRLELFSQLYYIQFLSKELQKNLKMSMNLRHKKPINSYRGQANNDKNEFNDDDFKHQPSPSKKFINPSGEQIYKYSKILAKFIMSSNQFYRQRNKHPKKQRTQIEHIFQEAKVTREESRCSKILKKAEQPKQKRKIIPKIQSDNLQSKQHKQKQFKLEQPKIHKDITPVETKKIDLKPPEVKNLFTNQQNVNIKPDTSAKTLPKINVMPEQNIPIFAQGLPMGMFSNMPPMYQNMMPVPNMQFSQYPPGWNQEMMKAMFYQQIMKNPQYKGINLNGIPQFMMQGAMMQNNQLFRQQYQIYNKNLVQQHVNIVKKNAPIHNLTDVYLKQKESIFNFSKENPNQMAKRSNFHVGLAYYIYMSEKKKRGQNMTNIDQIDPTRQSRLIKQREQSSKKNLKSKPRK